jgi:hypothetical protein
MVSDSTQWKGRIVFACNDLANEEQAIKLNPREIRGKLYPSISHSNLWFVEPDRIDDLGVPIGCGSVWMNDVVEANQSSDAYQFAGWDKRILHLSHETRAAVEFALEFDADGSGKWIPWKSVMVPAKGYVPLSLDEAPNAEWVRVRIDRKADGVTAAFHYSNDDDRSPAPTQIFDGLALPEDKLVTGGIVRMQAAATAPLGLIASDTSGGQLQKVGYYELDAELNLRSVDDAQAAAVLQEVAEIPSVRLTADTASILYIDEEGPRYRLPRGREAFDDEGPLGPSRIDREIVRERNVFNAYGTFYELPYRNAGGFSLIRPIATHNRRIKDYCSWRGLFVMTGIDHETQDNERIIRSKDRRAAVWLGVIDDL